MKDTVLLVGHGSRDPAGNREIEAFARQWRERRPDWKIDVCFIEFADVLVEAGLARAARDARRVIVVPLILNAAGHVKMEIPEHIETARARYPQTEFIYAPHLGACDPILAILKRRLHQAMRELDMPDPRTTGVILLGRGSSDRMANGEVAKMARWLQEAGEHELVDIAFTGITHPRLERVAQRHARLGMTQLVVLPYYLFTGTLMERIKRQVEHLRQQYPHIRFARSEYFGFEDEIFALLEQSVSEAGYDDARRMPCDGCKYREIAHDHGHGHHQHDDHQAHDHARAVQTI
ncbi:MAG: sirohydrochlorin chelatase [Pseudomonadota bacterium]